MPCTKCEGDNKYKWGETGECKYDSKESCEKANPKKYSKMNPTPLGKKTYEEYAKELKEFNLSKVERVELALIDDIEKLLDKGLAAKRKSEKIIRKEADNLREGSQFLADASSKAQKAVKAAKELGAKEAVTLFTVRLKEAQDFEDDMLKASNKVLTAIDIL
jgi:putative cell wall-binding protein